jgi:hypothetical protein
MIAHGMLGDQQPKSLLRSALMTGVDVMNRLADSI